MSADLFDFHRGGDRRWADEGWREKEADTAEPNEECGLLLSMFFSYSVTSIRGAFEPPALQLCMELFLNVWSPRRLSEIFSWEEMYWFIATMWGQMFHHFLSYSNQKRTLAAWTTSFDDHKSNLKKKKETLTLHSLKDLQISCRVTKIKKRLHLYATEGF